VLILGSHGALLGLSPSRAFSFSLHKQSSTVHAPRIAGVRYSVVNGEGDPDLQTIPRLWNNRPKGSGPPGTYDS
jgi:hypothetical protein